MLRWQRETQQACESLGWLVVETRGDDAAGWGCHLVFRGDAWGCMLYSHANCARTKDLAGLARLAKLTIRAPLDEELARSLVAAAPEPRFAHFDVPPDDADDRIGYLGALLPWPDEPWIAADAGREIVIWDLATRQLIARREIDAVCRDGMTFCPPAIDPVAREMVTADGIRELALWSLDRPERIRRFEGHWEEPHGAVFVEDGWIVSCSGDGTIRLWSRETGACLDTVESSPMYCIARNASSRVAVGGSSTRRGRIELYDPGLRHVRTIETDIAPAKYAPLSEQLSKRIGIVAGKRDSARVNCIAWMPDGRRIVTGGWDYVVKMFDVRTGKQLRAWTGHSFWVTAIAVSADGSKIVSGSSDGRVYVWSPDSEQPLVEHERLPDSIEGLHVDGDRIYAACFDGRVYVLP